MISFSRSGLALPLEVPDQGVRVAVGPVSEGSPEQILAGWGLSGSIRPYRRVYLMELPGECEFSRFWILKPMRIGAGRAACIARLLSHGAEWGIIPDLRWCGSDLLHRGLYQWYRGNRYLISRFLPGRTAEYQDYHDLSAALQTMGSFHVLTTRLLGEEPQHWEILRYNPTREWRIRLGELRNCKQLAYRMGDDWSRRYLKVWDGFYDQAQVALEELEQCYETASSFPTLCYHDWAHHNVLIDSKNAYLIDFDELILDCPAHDRANLIGRYLRLRDWSIKSLHRIIFENNRIYPWRENELRLTRIYLTFPYDYWILGRQYLIEQQPWSHRYYEDQWQRKIAPNHRRLKLLEIMARME
ncbi:MAG TPA: phosphotransferase [Bacillota bacterium]